MNEYYPDYNPGLWITACSIFGGSFGVFAGGWLSDRLVKKFGLHSRLWLLSVSTVKFLFNISKSFRQIDLKKKRISNILKPRYSEQVCQTLFVHYIE